ncbi:MAG: transcriptional regulator [Alishewanella sp. 34-51-39]|nr:MAG: transcriptional regulator [Alishewanella sp. 34-51-39]
MLDCDKHDYIEIVCLYRYPLLLTLHNGDMLSGTAIDTRYNTARQECLLLQQQSTQQLLPLSQIRQLKVTIDNPHLQQLIF